MAQQLKQQTRKPRFEDDEEKEFRKQIFYVFNPVEDTIETGDGPKSYISVLDDHAAYSCRAIETYMRAVLREERN